MSEAAIAKKETLVQAAAEKFESAASVVIVDYRGLTVEEVTNLRKQLRDAGVEMKVIKNSILSRAAKKVGLDGLDEVFTGPTAVAFSNDDVVAPAKSKVASSKEKFLQWNKLLRWQNYQTAKVYYLCYYLYYKRQSATWLTLSKQWQRKTKKLLNCSLIQTNKKQTILI